MSTNGNKKAARAASRGFNSLHGLDEMLGLIDYDEMYSSAVLPMVAMLKDRGKGDMEEPWYVIVSGQKQASAYKVRGILIHASADGFDGTLSLDGTSLKLSGSEENIEVDFLDWDYLGMGNAPLLDNALGIFSGNYGPFYAKMWDMGRVRNAMARIQAGETLRNAIEGASGSFRDDRSEIFDSLKGWYRTYRHRIILNEYRERFRVSGEDRMMDFGPIRERLIELENEIVNARAALYRAVRLPSGYQEDSHG